MFTNRALILSILFFFGSSQACLASVTVGSGAAAQEVTFFVGDGTTANEVDVYSGDGTTANCLTCEPAVSYSCTGFTGDYCQDFNATGTPSGWNSPSGSSSYDNTTPELEGIQNLAVAPGRAQTYTLPAPSSVVKSSAMVLVDGALENNEAIFSTVNTLAEGAYYVYLTTAGKVSITAITGTSGTGTTVLNANSIFYIKVIIDASAGTAQVYLWDGDSWELEASASGGRTSPINTISLGNSADTEMFYYDLLKINYSADISTP